MSPREKAIRQRLKDDFPHYASRCLRIKDKAGTVNEDGSLPRLFLNEAQQYLHARLEAQRLETGKVRALIVKGRQQGCSTYVEGRFYWKTSHRKGTKAYILTHEDAATTNLFEMAKTYHDHCPEMVRPSHGASNAKELIFSGLSSGYKVGTAGSKGTGRSSTIQLFHGSEVAYWPNAETHMAGVLQAVADLPGTEIILESTSNGPIGMFYEMCMAAQRGEGDYILIFIPWFWSKEYRKPLPPDWKRTSEEERYKEAHRLDDEQLAWRRAKIVELGGVDGFRREYPATVEEAFKASAKGALWTQSLIDATRSAKFPTDAEGKLLQFKRVVVGIDPSGKKMGDEAGIICGGITADKHVYIWEDRSGKLSPNEWATKGIAAYKDNSADRIVAEVNFGADMVETIIRNIDRTVSFRAVHASRGKQVRAEPVKALWEQGKAHIVGRLVALEDEMCTWEPMDSDWSPGRLDAMVWVVTDLALNVGTVSVGSF